MKKLLTPCLIAVGVAAATSAINAATILSQNFDTDPVNYVLAPGSEFIVGANTAKYWNLSNAPGITLNPAIVGNATTYLTGQNMDAPLPFTTGTPAVIDFTVNVTGFTDLKLSIDLAGLFSPEPENFVRVFTDDDNDGFYETPVFSFAGTGNAPYTDFIIDPNGITLTETFTTFPNLPLNFPTAADRNLRVRLELYNDTDSLNEAIGVDNIVISGVPEPTTGLLTLTGLLALMRRRRS